MPPAGHRTQHPTQKTEATDILLSYFLDMSDAEIANVLNMVRRSVAYRRTSTLKLLKNLMGGENR